MKTNTQKALLGVILLTVTLQPSLMQNLTAQQPAPSIRQRFVVVPASQRCHPAAVSSVSFGKQPPDVLLAQVMIENRSEQVISAVKLGWRVYGYPEVAKVHLAFCDPQPPAAEVFLSGATPLIQLDALASKETVTISSNPPPVPTSATKTALVERPLLTAEEVKSLPLGGPTPTIKYEVVVFVSEVHYADGTTWEIKSN